MDILRLPPDITLDVLLQCYNYQTALHYFLLNTAIVFTALLWGAGLAGLLLRRERLAPTHSLLPVTVAFLCIGSGMGLIITALFLLAWARWLTPEHTATITALLSGLSLLLVLANRQALMNLLRRNGDFAMAAVTCAMLLFLGAYQVSSVSAWSLGDSTSYHAPYAHFFLENRGLGATPEHLIYPFHSLNVNILYSLGLMLENDLSFLQNIHALFATLSMLGIYAMCRESRQHTLICILAPYLFVQLFIVKFGRFHANVDLGSMLFVFASVFSLYLWSERRNHWLLAVSAITFGMAIGTKYLMCIFAAPVALYIIWHERKSSLRPLLVYAAWGSVFGLYWYVRNIILTGNPVHPFATGIFGFFEWDKFDIDSQMMSVSTARIPRTLIGFLLMPWYAFHDQTLWTHGPFLVLCLLYLSTALCWLTPQKDKLLLIFSWIYLVSWFFGSQDPRHLQPVMPLAFFHAGSLLNSLLANASLLLNRVGNTGKILSHAMSYPALLLALAYTGFYTQQSLVRTFYENLQPSEWREKVMRENPVYDIMAQANVIFRPDETVFEFFMRDGRWFFKGNLVGTQFGKHGYWRILNQILVDNNSRFSPELLQDILTKKYNATGFIIPHTSYIQYNKEEFDRFFILEYTNSVGAIYRFKHSSQK